MAMGNYLENNPNYPPLPWWERAEVRGSMPCPPPPQSSPITGEDKTWPFSWFAGDEPVMKN